MLWLWMLACTRSEEGPFVPDLPTGGCGLESYAWAPIEGMGEIVAFEPLPDASLPKETINLMLAAAGGGELGPVPYGVRMFRVRYVTQDRGVPVEATALLSWPDEDGDYPTVLWTHPTVGFADVCAPSAGGLEEMAASILISSFGYAVAAPDYLGMNGWGEPSTFLHPYIVPEPTAVASLDAVRALWRFQDEESTGGARGTHRTVLWGASEGGFGALWADRYGTGYLPELEIVATVASVPPTDLLGLAEVATTVPSPATVGLVGVLATSRLWYGSEEPLSALVNEPIASELEGVMASQCGDGGLFDGVTTIEQVFTPDYLADPLAEPWGCMLDRATLRLTEVPRGSDAPVFLQVSELDDLVVGFVGRADAPRLCEAGYELDYLECAGAGHVDGAAASLPHSIRWVADRVAGVPLGETCVIGEPVDCSAL